MSIGYCFISGWANTFNYSGLATRKEYWSFIIINSVIYSLLALISETSAGIFFCLTILPSCSIGYRRLKDAGMEGHRFITLYVLLIVFCIIVVIEAPDWITGVVAIYVLIKAIICFIGTLRPSQFPHQDCNNSYEPVYEELASKPKRISKKNSQVEPITAPVSKEENITHIVDSVLEHAQQRQKSHLQSVPEEAAPIIKISDCSKCKFNPKPEDKGTHLCPFADSKKTDCKIFEPL